nr:hypothetical protein [Angustibacter aerolatus]
MRGDGPARRVREPPGGADALAAHAGLVLAAEVEPGRAPVGTPAPGVPTAMPRFGRLEAGVLREARRAPCARRRHPVAAGRAARRRPRRSARGAGPAAGAGVRRPRLSVGRRHRVRRRPGLPPGARRRPGARRAGRRRPRVR